MKTPYGEIMRKEINDLDFRNNFELRRGVVSFDNPVSNERKYWAGLHC